VATPPPLLFFFLLLDLLVWEIITSTDGSPQHGFYPPFFCIKKPTSSLHPIDQTRSPHAPKSRPSWDQFFHPLFPFPRPFLALPAPIILSNLKRFQSERKFRSPFPQPLIEAKNVGANYFPFALLRIRRYFSSQGVISLSSPWPDFSG